MQQLSNLLGDEGLQDPQFREERNMFQPIKDVILQDGSAVNIKDQGISLFLKMLDIDTSDGLLADVPLRLKNWFNRNLKDAGIASYNSPELQDLMKLQFKPDGLTELDRVITQLSDSTLSTVISRVGQSVIFNPDDAGLGGNSCFTLNILSNNSLEPFRENLALASNPGEAVKLIEQVLSAEGRRFEKFGYDMVNRAPTALYLRGNGNIEFEVPMGPSTSPESYDTDGSFTFEDHSDPVLAWDKINWIRHDRKVFKALVDNLPKSVANRVKGTFLSEELGI
jgi:hypothetical protein